MNKYFKPVDLPETEAKETPVEQKQSWPPKEFWDIITDKIAKELDLITTGLSKFTPYGIQLKPHGPLMSAFRRFKAAPTEENMTEFLSVTAQDVGSPAEKAFRQWCNLAIRETSNEKE